MKLVKNFLFAGEQDTPGCVPPPPPRVMSTSDEETTISGSNTEQGGGITAETSDYLFFEALAALLSVY
jgi:hypothetical protein